MEIIQVDTPMGNYNLKVMCLPTCAGQGDINSIFCRGVSMDSGSFDSPSRGMNYARKGIIRWLEISEQFAWKSLVNERLSYKLRFAPVLVWYHLFLYYPSIYNEDFMFFDTSMVLHGIFVFDTIWIYSMQEPTYLCKIALVSICFGMVFTQIITRVYKDSLTLTYPLDISIWLVLQFWYLWGVSLIPLVMLIIGTMHSPI